MTLQRFPKAKFVRQLAAMEDEVDRWRVSYLHAAEATTSEHLAGRFSGRAYVLEDVEVRARELRQMLEGLPRVT